METAFMTEAASPPDRDAQRSDRVVTMVASTDPTRALANIAQQRATHARRKRWLRGSLALLALGVTTSALALSLIPERSPRAARAGAQAPRAAAARSTLAPPAQVVTSDTEMSVAPAAIAADDPSARCQSDFQAHLWRAALQSCGAAFDAAPSPALAMRVAHSHWAHGDAAGGGVWGRRALELGGTDADAYVLIGHAARAAGDNPAALAAYRSYLEQAPRGWHAARLRGVVRELSRPAARETRAAR
jgi:hypothetical protein